MECLFLFYRTVVVVADYVPASIVGAEVVVHGSHCVSDGNILIRVVTGCFGYIEQEIQVHHIVDDNGEVPGSEVP